MGIYLNPGNKSFWEAVRSRIYVDKTNLIACTNQMINTDEKYVCVRIVADAEGEAGRLRKEN